MTLNERIEAAAKAFCRGDYQGWRVCPTCDSTEADMGACDGHWKHFTDEGENILRAACPELFAEPPGWIAPWKETPAMEKAWAEVSGEPDMEWPAMRDAYLNESK